MITREFLASNQKSDIAMINRASVAPNIKKKVTSPFKTTVKYCDHLSFIFHSDAEATAAEQAKEQADL